jgi:hypothetical protein
MGRIIIPGQHNAQMAKPIVFWWSQNLDHIMCPPSPIAPPPTGYVRVECRHANEVEIWSSRLRSQEKRIREMTDGERFEYEGKIQSHIIEELEQCLARSTDQLNREFVALALRDAKHKRETRRIEQVETFMACEAKEGIAK